MGKLLCRLPLKTKKGKNESQADTASTQLKHGVQKYLVDTWNTNNRICILKKENHTNYLLAFWLITRSPTHMRRMQCRG